MDYTSSLLKNGWAFIPGSHYFNNINLRTKIDLNNWKKSLKLAYTSLQKDPYSPGKRYRSYIQFKQNENIIKFGLFYDYLQTKEYNQDTGDIIRKYPKIHPSLLADPIFYSIIEFDIAIATAYENLRDISNLEMGIHLFRYRAKKNSPSFSSPLWLHKDDEDLVFIHHLKTSTHAIGGDNLIAPNGKNIEAVLRLTEPLDTLIVDHQKFHAVTPLGSTTSKAAIRDVILVTFQKEKNQS